jgi:hypothetical protein
MAKRQKPTGMSLTKGPVGVIGLGLAAYGVTAPIFGGHRGPLRFSRHDYRTRVRGRFGRSRGVRRRRGDTGARRRLMAGTDTHT